MCFNDYEQILVVMTSEDKKKNCYCHMYDFIGKSQESFFVHHFLNEKYIKLFSWFMKKKLDFTFEFSFFEKNKNMINIVKIERKKKYVFYRNKEFSNQI